MILLIENFDSFTYNIVQAYQQLGEEVKVVHNDTVTKEQIFDMNPSLLVLGPGPGNPKTAGISLSCVSLAEKGIPIFGICLGHQTIAEAYGGNIIRAPQPIHGKVFPIFHSYTGLFTGMPQGLSVTRYHSLIIEPISLPNVLEITAWTQSGEIMGIRHKSLPIAGVQFHPDSAASEGSMQLFQNSLNLSQEFQNRTQVKP